MEEKSCLILEGGGLRGAFVAGALTALADHGLTRFDEAIAVSASVPTLAYFASGQYGEIKKIWSQELATPKLIRYQNLFFSLSRTYEDRPLIDTGYLVYEVFKKKYPLDVMALRGSPIRCFFLATETPGLRPIYFGQDSPDPYAVMHACLALPGACPKWVGIDGGFYLDGGILSPIPYEKALEDGCGKLLFILTRPELQGKAKLSLVERLLFYRYFKEKGEVISAIKHMHRRYLELKGLLKRWESTGEVRALVIRPEGRLPAGRITRNPHRINATLDLGYRSACREIERIRAFMDGS